MADKDKTPFAYLERYPDTDIFFTQVSEEVDQYFEESIIVLDTSTLLIPYKTESKSLDEIGSVYGKLKAEERLLIPSHVMREYLVNRDNKLGEINKQILDLCGLSYSSKEFPILSDNDDYKDFLLKQDELQESFKRLRRSIKKISKKVKSWRYDDPVTELYKNVFSDNIIFQFDFDQTKMEEDLRRRTEFKIPPGYKDGKKDENSAGDLIIWHTILKIGESRKKPIVFVSGDTKADWWTQSMNSPLFPRFELLQEYKKSSDGQPIFFINFVDLLKKMHAQQSVIRDVTQKTDDQYNLWQRRNNLNRTMVLSKDRLEVHHLHRAYTDICFQSSEEIAGKLVDLRLSMLDSGNGVSHLKLETETLDFSDIEPSESPISRQISIFASGTPPQFVQRDTYGALTDIFLISASIGGKNIGQNTIIIEEKLLDIRCTVSPNPINIDSFSEVGCTLKVEIYPPLDEVIPINLGSPGAGHSIATSCETLETTLEDGVLKADVVFTFGELPEFFFEEGYTSGNGYIVNVGDAFGYRKQFYWTTLVNINFNPTKEG